MAQLPPDANPYSSTLSGGTTELTQVFQPIQESKGWINLIGIMTIIGGALYCLTIIGAVFGIPVLIMGLALRKSTAKVDEGMASNDANAFYEANKEMSKFFMIAGIMTAIGLLINVAFVGLSVLGMFFG